jgi:NAD(P)-dependent dehydrogenase (short-subunit alcohol dehydrogenase family)
MINLSSFPTPLNVAVIGATGGIGKAFLEKLEGHKQIDNVYSFSRSPAENIALDICDEESIKNSISSIDKPLHLIILATGLLHDDNLMPEKGLRDLTLENMRKVIEVNTIGPALVAKHFLSLLPREGKSVFAVLSARVGSISDNSLGGWYSYRASKSALNMLIKNISIEVARKHKSAAIIGLHPGTVDTSLSKPFQGQVTPTKLFSTDQSAGYLLDVINGISHKDTGKVFAWDAQEIKA